MNSPDLSIFAVLALLNKINTKPHEFTILDEQTIVSNRVYLELSSNSIVVRVMKEHGLDQADLFHIDTAEDVTTALTAFLDELEGEDLGSIFSRFLLVFLIGVFFAFIVLVVVMETTRR